MTARPCDEIAPLATEERDVAGDSRGGTMRCGMRVCSDQRSTAGSATRNVDLRNGRVEQHSTKKINSKCEISFSFCGCCVGTEQKRCQSSETVVQIRHFEDLKATHASRAPCASCDITIIPSNPASSSRAARPAAELRTFFRRRLSSFDRPALVLDAPWSRFCRSLYTFSASDLKRTFFDGATVNSDPVHPLALGLPSFPFTCLSTWDWSVFPK